MREPGHFLVLVSVAAWALLGACSGEGPVGPPSASTPQDFDGLVRRLRAAGIAVTDGGPVEQSFLSVKGKGALANGGTINVFSYTGASQAEAEAARIGRDGRTVEMPSNGGKTATSLFWLATPHFYKAEGLIVLYVGDDDKIMAALRTVFGRQFAGG